jgi:hypothetical protein
MLRAPFVEGGFRSDLNQRQGTIPYQDSPSDPDLSMPPLLQLANYPSSSMIENSSVQDRLPAVQDDAVLSGRDWFALPFDPSNDPFGNNFMQSFFEIDQVDTHVTIMYTYSPSFHTLHFFQGNNYICGLFPASCLLGPLFA